MLIPVDRADDPRVQAYRDIRERDLAGRQGLFVAEGAVVLAALLDGSRFRPVSLLIDQRRVEALAPLLDRVLDNTPVYAASQAVLDQIAGFHIHRGVLALGARGEPLQAHRLIDEAPPRALFLYLVGLANHDNVGGVFRNAAAFGVDATLLDATCCDPLYRKAIRVSVGGCLTVPFARTGPVPQTLARLAGAGFELLALSPGGKQALGDVRASPRTCLVLGAEGPGLPPDVLAQARTVRIDMAAGFDSLNVATTSGIALHHLRAIAG